MRWRIWSALLVQLLIGAAGLLVLGPSGLLAGAPVSGLLVPMSRRTWWGVAAGALVLSGWAIGLSWRISGHLSGSAAGLAGGLGAVLLVVAASLLLAWAASAIRPSLLLRAPRRAPATLVREDNWPEWDRPQSELADLATVAPPQAGPLEAQTDLDPMGPSSADEGGID